MTLSDQGTQRVTLKSGIALTYARAGSGPVLIFIHGAMGDYRAFAPQWPEFTKEFDCISYSRRYSYPNGNPLNTRNHNALVDAADLEELMDQLHIDKAILVGSSYGGFTALAMAVRAPSRVAALVSVEAPMMRYAKADPAGAPVVEAFLKASAHPARDAFERGEDALGARLLTGGIVGKAPESVPDHVMTRRMVNLDGAKSLALSDDEFPLLTPEELGALSMPILLISGADTAPVHSAIFKAVSAALPQARAEIIPRSGHSVTQQAPEAFNNLVRAFLKDEVHSGLAVQA